MSAKKSNVTTPRQFRLQADTLADLDLIAAALTDRDAVPRSRADAVRFAARKVAEEFRKKSAKSA